MKQKKSISAPKSGMNKDVSAQQLGQTDYISAVNINSVSESGDSLNVQLEPSNRLNVVFPTDYKVIHFKNDLTKNRTYYFLTSIEQDKNNPNYKRSSIGYVDNLDIDYNNTPTQVECDDCGYNNYNQLTTPLELIIQTPSLTYVELSNDKCLPVGEGFNFDVNFPINKSEINQEKLGTTLYWDDNRNPPRYLNVSDIEERGAQNYLTEVSVACEDPVYSNCIDVDKLLIFPKYNQMVLEAFEKQTGGNLKKGTYEFWGAYCDLAGNPMTQYSTPTNPISIFDENNNILDATTTDEFTNFAIKIKVKGLDTRHFKYYKVAVVERNNVNNTQSVFLAGIYPTTDDTVVYTHSGSSSDALYQTRGNVSLNKGMDLKELTAIKSNWEKAKFTMVSGDILWHGGLVEEEEINIQPVLNLIGGLVHWQSSAASEKLYSESIATSKYKAYPRNEVQPFAIRLLYTNGGYSANFPIVARPKIGNEGEVLVDDKNLESLTANSNSCTTTDREQRWQVYNTATKFEDICVDIEDSQNSTVSVEDVTKTCVINAVATLPNSSVEIVLEEGEEFYDLKSYVKENPTNPSLTVINNALKSPYSDDCTPIYDLENCNNIMLLTEHNEIGTIVGEVQTPTRKNIAEYVITSPPTTIAGTQLDDQFKEDSIGNCSNISIRFRQGDFSNESCSNAIAIPEKNSYTQVVPSITLNYDASSVEADMLQDTWNVSAPTIVTNFKNRLHKKSQFFNVTVQNREEVIFEVSQRANCQDREDFFNKNFTNNTNKVRYTIYDNCVNKVVKGGGIVDLNNGLLIELTIANLTLSGSSFIIALDSPMVVHNYLVEPICVPTGILFFVVAPPCGFGISIRAEEYKSINVAWTSLAINKVQKYVAECTFRMPKVNDCEPIPYKKGKFAYWESTEEYEDNKQLWDSSELKIDPSDLTMMSGQDRVDFLSYYTNGVATDGNYILKDADFRCQKIRHPKFPDNTVSPYMIDNINFQKEADSIIFPLGIELDSKVIKTAINIAYKNGLITKKQKDKIRGYEILRGDNSVFKSIVANGIAFDFYNYEKNEETVQFANFPFNDLGTNKYCLTTENGVPIPHPNGGNRNHLYSFLSPDVFLTKPSLPTEVSLQGFVLGNSSSEFVAVDRHSEWTVLGGKARRIALRLATLEVALETVIQVGEMNKHHWAVLGVGSSGANFMGMIAAAFATPLITAGAPLKVGKYRFEWLRTFRDLGRTYNFASTQVGVANYNKFLKVDQENSEYLRRLTIKKYLKEGDYIFVDENDGKQIRINNWQREASVFLSTGEQFPFEYTDEAYKDYDNNTIPGAFGSNFIASDVGAEENIRYQRNVASPYFSLKNYIPNQWGTIDSVKWLTTNSIFDLEENTICKTIFGGTYVISRFSWRRKVPIFRKNAITTPNKTPFMYSRYGNVGFPRFYGDYELDDGDNIYEGFLGIPYPDISSTVRFDDETGRNSMYYRPPSKFYTSVHGVVNFLVESEINCNFRYARNSPKDFFYPQAQNLSTWLQETNLPISEPNTFFYNNIYSNGVSNTSYKLLDKTYVKEEWAKRAIKPNAVIWSEKDVNEVDFLNSWLVYRPLNFHEFKTNNGKLIDLYGIENEQFLARFENRLMQHNTVDTLAERLRGTDQFTGSGGIFAQRPMEFQSTDLGFMGTQHSEMISTPYGHFWIDAMRGKIFNFNGKNAEIISEQLGNQPTNMKQWFREHLPMKILRYFPNINTDNKFKGLGYNMWWDDRETRLFITKRDYIVKNADLEYNNEIGFYIDTGEVETSCPDGYTYNSSTQLCEKEIVSSLCPIGYTYNTINSLCEKITLVPATCTSCSAGMDVAFLVDYTLSMGGTIGNAKVSIESIIDKIVEESQNDYKLSLTIFDEYSASSVAPYANKVAYTSLPASQKLVYVPPINPSLHSWITTLETFGESNRESFTDKLDILNTPLFPLGSGADALEPATFGATRIVDFNIAGAFREGIYKLLIIITDVETKELLPNELSNLILSCQNKEVVVMLLNTSGGAMPKLVSLATSTEGLVSIGQPNQIIAAIDALCSEAPI